MNDAKFVADVDHGLIGKTPQAARDATPQALTRNFDYIYAVFAKKQEAKICKWSCVLFAGELYENV